MVKTDLEESELMQHSHPDLGPEGLPSWLLAPYHQFSRAAKEECRYLHLSMTGLSRLQVLPRVSTTLASISRDSGDEEAAKLHESRLEDAREVSKWVAAEVDRGFPLLHRHCTVGIWSALEALHQDLATGWLSNCPDAWTADEVLALRLKIAEFRGLGAQELAQLVVARLEKAGQP